MNFLNKLTKKQVISVIKIDGIIDQKMTQKVTAALKRINPSTSKAVAVLVNSPGGSAVQSDLICSQVKGYCKQHKLQLYTFADDVAASGGYFILSIGDKVYVDSSSLVGSVGVIAQWLGVKNLMDSKKIEQRNFATQKNLIMDLFSPFNDKHTPEQKAYLEKQIKQTHQTFINHVEEHRGNAIKVPKEERAKVIYNADVFNGEKAVELGLADKVGNYQDVLFSEFPQASLEFVVKKTLKERFNDKGVIFNISLPKFGQTNEKALNQQMTNEFLSSFKN